MNIDEKVAAEIYNEIIIDLITDYKQRLQNEELIEYLFIQEFYRNLDEDKKEKFILFLDSFAMDIVSVILGGFDGSTKLGNFFGGFTIKHEGEEITPYLQDNFLGIYEDNFDKKTRQDIKDLNRPDYIGDLIF